MICVLHRRHWDNIKLIGCVLASPPTTRTGSGGTRLWWRSRWEIAALLYFLLTGWANFWKMRNGQRQGNDTNHDWQLYIDLNEIKIMKHQSTAHDKKESGAGWTRKSWQWNPDDCQQCDAQKRVGDSNYSKIGCYDDQFWYFPSK